MDYTPKPREPIKTDLLKNCWGGNITLDHESGKLTDEIIKKMTDEQLRVLAFGIDGVIKTELYRRPYDRNISEAQGGRPGEIYVATHRALFELKFRGKS